MPSTFKVGQAWNGYVPVTTSQGPAHWSTQHRRLVDLSPPNGPPHSIGFPGPARVATDKEHVASACVVGVSYDVVAAAGPVDVGVRRAVASHLTSCWSNVARDGWAVPRLRDVWLTVEGRVVVVVARGAPADFGPRGYPDTPTRDAHNDRRDDAIDAAERAIAVVVRDLGVDDVHEAVDSVVFGVADLVAARVPDVVRAHAALVASCGCIVAAEAPQPPRAAPPTRAPPAPAPRDGPALLGDLLWREAEPGPADAATVGDAALRAQFTRLRGAPVTSWSASEMVTWRSLLRVRRRAVVAGRGLTEVGDAHFAAVENVDVGTEAALWGVDGRTLGGAFWLKEFFPALHRAFVARSLNKDVDAGLVEEAARAAEVERLMALGMFAIVAQVEIVLEGSTTTAAQERWRTRVVALDAELGDRRRALLATTPPTLS